MKYNTMYEEKFQNRKNAITEARKHLDMSQRELAKLLDTTQQNVQRYEKGRTLPIKLAMKLLKFLPTYKLDDFYGEINNA